MKWAYRIRRKITTALLLAAIFVIMFTKNILDNNYVSQLGSSFSSVYEDRLLVESYIYELSDHLFRKKIMIDTCSSQATARHIRPLINSHNEAINRIILHYEKTKLTEAESFAFAEFKENVRNITELEAQYLGNPDDGSEVSHASALIGTQFNQASENLRQLSRIQISEGKMLNDHSKKIIAGSSILTQFEIGIMVIIGLVILVLIFESKSVFPVNLHNQSLN